VAELLQLAYSPWSERARWALDAEGIRYRKKAYLPMIGEPALRVRLRRATGPVSVPVLFTDGGAVEGSWDIACHAAAHGGRDADASILPPALRADIAVWQANGEVLTAAGRSLLLLSLVGNVPALRESVPRPLRALGPIADLLAVRAATFIREKYEPARFSSESALAGMRTALRALRAAIGKNEFVVGGRFTYADIAMATSLQVVVPVSEEHIRLGPATREAWTNPALAAEFPDLIAWRDRIYAQHRSPGARPPR